MGSNLVEKFVSAKEAYIDERRRKQSVGVAPITQHDKIYKIYKFGEVVFQTDKREEALTYINSYDTSLSFIEKMSLGWGFKKNGVLLFGSDTKEV